MFLAYWRCDLPDKKLYGNCLYWCKYVRDFDGATQWLKATVPDRRVWLPTLPVLSLLCTWARRLKTRTQRCLAICTSVRPSSTEDCTSGNKTRTQHACDSVPIRIVSYSYTVIVPCTAGVLNFSEHVAKQTNKEKFHGQRLYNFANATAVTHA